MKFSFKKNGWKILLLLYLGSGNVIWGQELKFKHITPTQGLSHSTVYDICQDKKGFMWFGTREGLNRYDGYSIKTYYSGTTQKDTVSLLNNQVNCLLSSKKGLFIGTNGGLDKYNPEKDNFKKTFHGKKIKESVTALHETKNGLLFIGTVSSLYLLNRKNRLKKIMNEGSVKAICNYKTGIFWLAVNKRILLINTLGELIKEYDLKAVPNYKDQGSSFTLNTLYKGKKGNIWLGTSQGLFRFSKKKDQFVYFPIDNGNRIEANVVRDITEDEKGQLWLATESGLFIYNPKTKKTVHYSHSLSPNASSLSDKSIYSLCISNEGITWIGTYFGGVNYTIPEGRGFRKLTSNEDSHSLHGKAVSEIIKDEANKLWIATEDGGISILDEKNNQFSYLNDSTGLSSNNVHSLYEDDQGYIWIGTFLGGLNRYNKKTKQITTYNHKKGNKKSLSNNYVYSIMQDDRDRLWIGTQYGLNLYNAQTDNFRLFKPELFAHKFIYDMIQDKKGNFWICTRFSGIYHYIPAKDSVEHFSTNHKNNSKITSNQVISVMQDSNEGLWFGTLNGGLLKWNEKQKNFKSFKKTEGLPNNNVYGVLEDKNKKLWLTTNKGLSKFDPREEKFTNYTSRDGLSTNQFNFKSAYKDDKGWLYFGSINGLTYFHPDSLKTKLPVPNIEFTGFKLFNKDVPVSKNGVLHERINLQDSLKLKYWQNVLTFEFAALNFEPSNNYAYYLEGFENSWNNVGNKHTATYTNLSPGEYTFKVKTLPLSNSNVRRIHLTVLPPFWRTNWAYFGYFMLLLLGIYGYWRFVRFVHAQKLAVHMEKVEKDRINTINQDKLKFFTFISHEFKTPLTLIIAAIEKYFQKNTSYNNSQVGLFSIKKSAVKLQHLVQQLMEFRNIETTHAKLNLRKGDVILFLKDTFGAFSLLMEEKNFSYACKADFSEYFCYFDADKLEMIVTNLISNAIHYTPKNGEIRCNIHISNRLDEKNRSQLQVSILDSGKGMDAEEIANSFDPFYKSKEESKKVTSSGIGLALVKSLIQFLEGKIDINSTKDKGSRVTITIPLLLKLENEPKKEIALIEGNKNLSINPDLFNNDNPEHSEERKSLPKDLSVMIVEDDIQLMKFLKEHFSSKFKVITAKNGKKALEKTKKQIPDIIISDIKMKEMDGINFCKKIKNDPETNHIPFLLLTGKTESTYKMESLKVGANAFINKPFSLNELDLLVKNLLETNQNIEKRFAAVPVKSLEEFPKTNQNQEFLKKMADIVTNNYSDPNFSIESLAGELGISRSLLHLKIKKATGSSASVYLKKTRMQKAIDLIKSGHVIAEVAYNVGYNDPNYFSRVFKKEFHVSPSHYEEKRS